MGRFIKLSAGLTGKFELIFTDASDEDLIEYMVYVMDTQKQCGFVQNSKEYLSSKGFLCLFIGTHDTDGLLDYMKAKAIPIEKEFDYYDFDVSS